MEYIAHGDLAQYIKNHGPKAATEVQDITAQILKGLVVLHEREICHRDLKPQVSPQSKQPTGLTVAIEYPHRVTLTNLGQNHRFWYLKAGTGNLFTFWVRHHLLPSARATRIAA